MGTLQNANRDIGRELSADRHRRRQAERLGTVIHAIDDLLFQLEELNLRGQDRVPATLRERAGAILEVLPPQPQDPDFRVRHRVTPMMDVLFRAQEVLFQLRDPARPQDEDEDLLA